MSLTALTSCGVGSSTRPSGFLTKDLSPSSCRMTTSKSFVETATDRTPPPPCEVLPNSSVTKGSKFSLHLGHSHVSEGRFKAQAEEARCLKKLWSHEDNHKIHKQLLHCDMFTELASHCKPAFSTEYHQPRFCSSQEVVGEKNPQKPETAGSIPSISCIDLVPLLVLLETTIILDCRCFMAFNANHVAGAQNINLANKLTRKRLVDGRLTIADLINGAEAKEEYRRKEPTAMIVVYDDNSTDVMSLPVMHPLKLVVSQLQKEGRNVQFLHGGIQSFQATYKHFCANPDATPTLPLLYSPTSQDVDVAVDSAKATEIFTYLFIGNERDASSQETLKELGITHILNVTSHIPFHFEDSMTCKRLQASDSGSQNLKQYFDEAVSFIESVRLNNGRVLVHCQAGVSRSPTIVMAYIIAVHGQSLKDAFSYVHSRRSIISPNLNFMGQLLEFSQRNNHSDMPFC